jgi:predicted TIM-barrel fold metal-dependent hydrolase
MRAIDAWVNADMPRMPAAWQKDVAETVFKKPAESIFRKFTAQELITEMDAAGVQMAVLTLHADRPSKTLLGYAELHPDRFAYSVLLDPSRGMKAVRQLDALARSHDVRIARVIPSLHGAPPSDRMYYPLYAKCVELGLPVSINTGIPPHGLPARHQDPIHIDDVCLFFPELTVIMANGADPWWDVAMRLMTRFEHLYLMTSAFAPRYLPSSLVQFMNTRGMHKVMFATDFPFLTMSRCMTEAKALALREDALRRYLHGNAADVLGARAKSDVS